jgi:hypothetical protein
LQRFFDWAGIRKVRVEDMPLEGALRRLPDGRFDILVRENAAPARQRFSIAHELGHVLFYRHAPIAKARQLQLDVRAPQEEERLCNIAAEELLMPQVVAEEGMAKLEGAEKVMWLADRCDVSVEAAMVRLAPMWNGRGEIQLWRHDGTWKPQLAVRIGRTRGSLATFGVDEWSGQRTPSGRTSLRRARTSLYSREKRTRLFARTDVVSLPRKALSLLICHELTSESEHKEKTSLELAQQVRVHRAALAPARPGCANCGGSGMLYPDPAGYPANRNEAPRLCECRYGQPRGVLSA